MTQFIAYGTVPSFKGYEFNLRVDNARELEAFYRDERIDTKLFYAEGKPALTVRGELAARCKPYDRVRHIIETKDRKNGRGIIGVSIEVI
jgi:hypothetical protein